MENSKHDFEPLRTLLSGELSTAAPVRAMYSTDASPYKIVPQAVAFPASKEDVTQIMEWAKEHKVPIHGRGTGSGLTGACIGSGIVIDFKRYMNKVLSVDVDNKTVTVEPGVVLSVLNLELSKYNLFFPPDPASGDYCTLGGMISNNSSGARSVKYGATIDYIESLKVITPVTGLMEARVYSLSGTDKKSESQLSVAGESSELEPNDANVKSLLSALENLSQEDIRIFKESLPDAPKNCCGYRLERAFAKDNSVDLGALICSSEGTLALITEATLNILPLPEERLVTLLNFSSLKAMSKAVELILPLDPSAVEVMDHVFLNLVVKNYPHLKTYVPDNTVAQLLVEMDGTKEEAEAKVSALHNLFKKHTDDLTGVIEAKNTAEQEQLWKVRKSALPILFTLDGPGQITPFIEDVSVAPAQLGVYLEKLHAIFEEKGLESAVYGHAGEGNLHTRPILNLRLQKDVDLMAELADKIFDLVSELNGSISGEHGDGRLRTSFLPAFYKKSYGLLKEVKTIFDPENILNPGIIATPKNIGPLIERQDGLTENQSGLTGNQSESCTDCSVSMTSDLRMGPGYKTRQIPAPLGGSKGSLARAIEKCHGCGNCTTPLENIPMCPLFKATGIPQSSPRGKLNIAQALLVGDFGREQKDEEEIIDYLSLCLGCGLCEINCPSKVETSQIVNQLRSVLKNRTGMPLKDKILSLLSQPLPSIAQPFAAVGSVMNKSSLFRKFLETTTSISSKAPLFKFAPVKLSKSNESGKRKVVYFPDIYAVSCDPSLGYKTMNLIHKAGYSVYTNPDLIAATPGFAKGDAQSAKAASHIVRKILTKAITPGTKLLFSEPTAMRTVLHEHLQFFVKKDEQQLSKTITEISTTVTDFLLQAIEDGSLKAPVVAPSKNTTVVYHSPCHLIDTKEEKSAVKLLKMVGYNIEPLMKRCCGLAGTFGLQRGEENTAGYEISVKTGQPLFDDIIATKADIIACECSSCRLQLEHNTNITALHPIELLFKLY